MINIPTISEQVAEAFSQAIYNLMMPTHLRDSSYATSYYCPWQEFNNVYWLRFPESMKVYIHAEADIHELDPMIQYLIDTNQAPSTVLEEIQEHIETCKGTYANLSLLIPQFWLEMAIPDSAFEHNDD